MEYVESMGPDRKQEKTGTVAERISNRHRDLEQVEPRAVSTENVDIGMEAAERGRRYGIRKPERYGDSCER